MTLVKDIDAILPQTQCQECGYPGCLPYAQALAHGQAAINKCPPGGIPVLESLGTLLNIDPAPYRQAMLANTKDSVVAVIREAECIGCTICLNACPVDAIIGSKQLMHAVISHECTGCGLCVEPCPVDCIEIQAKPQAQFDKNIARSRHHAKQLRKLAKEHEKQQAYRKKRQLAMQENTIEERKAKQQYILQALARVGAKKLHE